MKIRNLCPKVNKKYAGVAALAVCLLLSALLIGGTIARYRTQLKSETSAKAKEFYFTSDFLDGGTHTLAPGSASVLFTLSNHADDLRFSEVEIAYEVTVTSDDATAIPTVTYDSTTQKLGYTAVQDDKVTIGNLQSGKTYTVTATGTGGYVKTLTATIQVLSSEAQLYQHLDNSPDYLLLTVWNEGDTAGNVTIQYKGIPDNTNPNMQNWTTAEGTEESKTVTINAHESKVFRFFGEGATVTVTDAEKKTPG